VSVVGLVVLVVVLGAATLFGLLRRQRGGRLRAASGAAAARLTRADLGVPLGERATFVQFSSAFCRPCVATRQVLGSVAAAEPGVAHIDIDAESHLDLVRRLDVRSTPTTLLLDGAGVERHRAGGVPRKPQVLAALAELGQS
jgi:thiol-disulfide isomerase/thioredoxin